MKKEWLHGANRVAFEHSKALTAYHSKSFYFSTRLLPKSKQWATFALYGFCRYADNLIDNPRDRSVPELLAEVKYLRRELEIAYRTGESEHPIIHPFISVAREYGIPKKYPLALLDGVQMDLERNRYTTFDELYLFAYRVAGVVGVMMTYVLGYKDPVAFKYAEKLGVAMQLTNILRDVEEDAERNRIYLPLDELERFGVSEEEILSGKMTPAVHELMRFQVERAHGYYRDSAPGIAMLETDAQFAIQSASKIYRGILMKIEGREYNPFLGRVFVSQLRKAGILFREVLRTKIAVVGERLIPVGLWEGKIRPEAEV